MTICNETHKKDCTCSYCYGYSKLHYGLNIPKRWKEFNSWYVIKYWKRSYFRWTNSWFKWFRKNHYTEFNPYPEPKFTSKEIKPETKARIEILQKKIDESGWKHIHFSWNWEELSAGNKSLDEVANSICDILESYINGNYEIVDDIDETKI